MTYRFAGESLTEDRYYRPPNGAEVRAKFAYFREAESEINGGPAPIEPPDGCGTNAGYMRHYRNQEARCLPCKEAHAYAEARRNQKRRILKRNPQPIHSGTPKRFRKLPNPLP